MARLSLAAEQVRVDCPDPQLAGKLRDLARRPLPHLSGLTTPTLEASLLEVSLPGTHEHFMAMVFEVRKFGIEALPEPVTA